MKAQSTANQHRLDSIHYANLLTVFQKAQILPSIRKRNSSRSTKEELMLTHEQRVNLHRYHAETAYISPAACPTPDFEKRALRKRQHVEYLRILQTQRVDGIRTAA